jgi:hypothetical protein
MDTPLTLLYTHNLRGDLSLLPRLHTFIKQLKALEVDDEDDVMLCLVQPQTRRFVLIDLGGSCAPDVWHCAVTGGRSMLMVLDAMGYAAVSAADLTPDARAKLADSAQMGLIDAAHRWESDGVIAATTRQPDPGAFQIVLQPGDNGAGRRGTFQLCARSAIPDRGECIHDAAGNRARRHDCRDG